MAHVAEDRVAVGDDKVLGHADAIAGIAEEARQRRPPYLPFVGSQVVAVDLQQIEGVQKRVARAQALDRSAQRWPALTNQVGTTCWVARW